ncbi:MAG: FtsX-like permease family protein [Acidimicrobiia bacterium]
MSALFASLRMALRQVRRDWVRSSLIALLVAAPMAATTWIGIYFTTENQTGQMHRPLPGEATLHGADFPVRPAMAGQIAAIVEPIDGVRIVRSAAAVIDPWTEVDVSTVPDSRTAGNELRGTWPQAPTEVAVSGDVAEALGVDIGDTITTGDLAAVVVTGVHPFERNAAWVTSSHSIWDELDWALQAHGPPASFVGVPDRIFARVGGAAQTSAWVNSPGDAARSPDVLLAPTIGLFALLATSLVSAAVMAIGLRRRIRHTGLLAVTGAGPAHMRLVLATEAAVVSTVGVMIGCGLGLYAATRLTAGFGHLRLETSQIALVAVVGLLVGPVFGIPAAELAARTPLAAAREGRIPPAPTTVRGRKLAGLALTATSLVGVAQGWIAGVATPSLALGGVAAGVGVLVAFPLVHRLVDRSGHHLPTPIRMAVRDLRRNQSRSAGTITVMVLVMLLPVAAMVMLRGYDVEELPESAMVRTPSPNAEVERAALDQLVTTFPDAAPLRTQITTGPLFPSSSSWRTQIPPGQGIPGLGHVPDRAVVVDPAELALLGMPNTTALLGAGQAVMVGRWEGTGSWSWTGPRTVTIPLAGSGEQSFVFEAGEVLLTEDTARRWQLAVSDSPAGQSVDTWLLGRSPTRSDATTLAMTGVIAHGSPRLLGALPPGGNLVLSIVLRGGEAVRWAALAASSVLVALVAAIIGSLIRIDADDEIARAVAVGASQRFRRHYLASAQGAVALTAGLISGAVGLVMVFWLDLGASDFDGMATGVPWRQLALISIGMPIIVSAATWIVVRSKPVRPVRRPA